MSEHEIVSSIDMAEFNKKSVRKTYPYVLLELPNNTTPLIVTLLPVGDMPLVASFKGEKKLIKRITRSAYNIDKLIRTSDGVYLCVSEEESVHITTMEAYLEVAAQWT